MRYLSHFNLLSIGVACLLFASVEFAQDRDVTRQELANFDRFLDSHAGINKDLQNDPSLIKDNAYLSAHPELKEFLASHPGVREEIRENPKGFMNRERIFDKNGKDITNGEVRRFDEFLDRHPSVDRELSKSPSLVNDREYVEKHPELREYLASHPNVREEIREHPRVFMRAEKKFEKKENKAAKAKRKEEREKERRETRLGKVT